MTAHEYSYEIGESEVREGYAFVASGGRGWECAVLGLPAGSDECAMVRDGFSAASVRAWAVGGAEKGAVAICTYFGAAKAGPLCAQVGGWLGGTIWDGGAAILDRQDSSAWKSYRAREAVWAKNEGYDAWVREAIGGELLDISIDLQKAVWAEWVPDYAGESVELGRGPPLVFPDVVTGPMDLLAVGAPRQVVLARALYGIPDDPYPRMLTLQAPARIEGIDTFDFVGKNGAEAAADISMRIWDAILAAAHLSALRVSKAIAILDLTAAAKSPKLSKMLLTLSEWDTADTVRRDIVAKYVVEVAAKLGTDKSLLPGEMVIYRIAAGQAMASVSQSRAAPKTSKSFLPLLAIAAVVGSYVLR